MYGKTIVLLVGLSAVFMSVMAQDEMPETEEQMVVLGTKSELPLNEINGRVLIVTSEEIEKHQWKTVADILQTMPGVSLVRNGGDGKVTTVFMRGANSENTLVLLNGTKLNDPSGVGRGYDFGHLSTVGIERLELILGPQSTLYGTDASSGVINIVTTSGSEELTGKISSEFSDEDSVRFQVGVGGRTGKFHYAVQADYYDSDSISAAVDPRFMRPETDGYENTTFHIRLSYDLEEGAETGLNLSNIRGDNQIDAFDGDDPNSRGKLDQKTASWHYRRSFLNDRWDMGFYTSYSDVDRENRDAEDDLHPGTSSRSDFNGTNLNFEWRNQVNFQPQTRLNWGIVHEREEADSTSLSVSPFFTFGSQWKESTDANSIFAALNLTPAKGFNLDLGVRYDDHSDFGGETTYRFGTGYVIEPWKSRIYASFGTGFKAPSIFQLFSSFGNPQLDAETARSFDAGWTTTFLEGKGEFGVNYYSNDFENLIDFGASNYINISEAETSGYEIHVRYNQKNWGVVGSFEDLTADNVSVPGVNIPLLRRFDDKYSLKVQAKPVEALQLFCDFLFYGESLDTNFNTFQTETVGDYTLINLGGSWTFGPAWNINLRADNLGDENYTQILGFTTHGRRIFAGATLSF